MRWVHTEWDEMENSSLERASWGVKYGNKAPAGKMQYEGGA